MVPESGGHGWGEVGDVVDFVLVQANARHQRHLYLVGREDAQGQRVAVGPRLLGSGEQAGDVVAGMRVVGREVGVVHVEFAHGYAVGERRPTRSGSCGRWPRQRGGRRCCGGGSSRGRGGGRCALAAG